MSAVWASSLEDLTEVMLLLCLADHADDDGGNCYPGHRRLARMARVSEKTVGRTLRRLEQDGWIEIMQRGDGRGNFSEYRVNVAAIREKRCPVVPLSAVRKRGTARKKKGDTGTVKGDFGDTPLFRTTKNHEKHPPPPLPPPLRGPVDAAIDEVCAALGVRNRRRRRMLRDVIEGELECGAHPEDTGKAMIAAWENQARQSPYLRRKLGLSEFFGDGYWKDGNRWHWDEAELRRRAGASIGSAR
jgi:hypothetical protein